MKPWTICLIGLFAGISLPLRAGMESSGSARMVFSSNLQSIPDNMDDFIVRHSLTAESFMSASASCFTPLGVLVWIGFPCKVSNQPRSCTLMLDLDTGGWNRDKSSPLKPTFVKVSYLETQGKEVLYQGELHTGNIWIDKLVLDNPDYNRIEGSFEIIIADPLGTYPGARAFIDGRFSTDPRPPTPNRIDNDDPYQPHYAEGGCLGVTSYHDEPYQDEGCDCGGDDYDDEGWDEDSDSGCEGDTTSDYPEDNSCSHAGGRPGKPNRLTRSEPTRIICRMLPLLAAVFLLHRRRKTLP